MEPVERRVRTRSRAEFYTHLVVYAVVNLMLVVINVVTWRGSFWAMWPLLGWGIGIAAHALKVFVFAGHDDVAERVTDQQQHAHKPA